MHRIRHHLIPAHWIVGGSDPANRCLAVGIRGPHLERSGTNEKSQKYDYGRNAPPLKIPVLEQEIEPHAAGSEREEGRDLMVSAEPAETEK